jgi:hypothetical protein
MGEWRGINSPRHHASRWLMAIEKHTFGWINACFSGPSVHAVPPLRHLAVVVLWHNWSDAIHWWCVGSSGAEGLLAKMSLLVSSRPSDRLTLPLAQGVGSSGVEESSWHVSVLIQTKHWIDRRYPHLDRQIIWCYCVQQPFSPSNHPMQLKTRPSDHLTVATSFGQLRRVPSAPTLLPRVPSVYPTVSFLVFSRLWLDFTST